MKKIINKHFLSYFIVVLVCVITAIIFSVFSIKFGSLIDVVVSKQDEVIKTIIECVLCGILFFVFGSLLSYALSKNVSGIIKDLKDKLYESINKNDIGRYVSKPNEYYLNNLTKNIDILKDNFLVPRCDIIDGFCSSSIAIGTIFFIHWKLCIIMILITIVTIFLSQLPGVYMAKKTKEFSEQSEKHLKVINNHLKGFEYIKLLGVTRLFFNKYSDRNKKFEKSRFRFMFTFYFSQQIGMLFNLLGQIGCMSVGVYYVLKGELSIGILIAVTNLLGGVFNPIQTITKNKNLMKSAKDIINEFDLILKTQKVEGNTIDSKITSINIKNLSFSFDKEKNIFKNFNINFENNNKYAILGESGKGKSTLAKILMKYYPESAYKGNITINGESINKISTDAIYSKIAYIQRNEFFVEGSVKENISLYRDGLKEKEICKALKFNENFLEKQIQSGSEKKVSMGEKQRIDIGRYLIANHDVLIFDEPTSNLDRETSDIIFDLIFNIKDKIVIVITHVDEENVLNKFDKIIRL